MADSNVNNNAKPDYAAMVKEYAQIQTQAYTSQSAKSADISSLKDEFKSYFDANPDAAANKDKVLTDLDHMQSMALAHEQDPTHTDNGDWDSARSEMDSMLKEMAPEGADVSAIDSIPHGAKSAASTSTTTNLLASSGSGDAAAGTAGSMSMVSLDAMVQKFPQLAPYKQAFVDAGAKYNVPPQILAAQAMQESHAGTDSAAGGNMMQFIPSTWDSMNSGISYGQLSLSNAPLQIEMAAKYDAQLLNDNGGDWDKTLRGYNGPVADGANSEYQTQIAKWVRGTDGYQS